jgi:hypothetical protein
MQLALRPYVTTGVAIVGASVIAVAPIIPTPTDIQIPNPVATVERGVELTAGQIETAFNQVIFLGTQVAVTLAKLPAPLVAQLLGVSEPEAQIFLALGTIGLLGPLISGGGSIGTAIQNVVNKLGSGDLIGLLNSLIGAPATIIDGLVNGDYGPDLGSLINKYFPKTFAGGLINPGNILQVLPPWTAPGFFPTIQGLVTQLFDQLGGLGGGILGATAVAPLAASVPTPAPGPIEGAVNTLLFNLVARPVVAVAGLVGSLLAPLIGKEQAALLPVAALGLLGPLISGPGAIGTATQDVLDSLGKGNFAGVINSLIGAPATIIDGFVNGSYGPSLTPLVGPILFPGVPEKYLPPIFSGGLINGAKEFPVTLPGTIPTLQKLVSQILGSLPGLSALSSVTPFAAKTGAEPLSINSVDTPDTSGKKLVTLDVAPDTSDQGGKKTADTKLSAPDTTPSDAGSQTSNEVKDAIDSTDPGPGRGKAVSDAAKPDTAHGGPKATTNTDTVDTSDGNKVIPDTPGSDDEGNGNKKKGGSNPVGSAISSVANGLAGAVRGALGG